MTNTNTYAAAGVNIAAGQRAVDLMSSAVRATYGPEVLAGIGAFGGLFDAAKLKAFESPVLVGFHRWRGHQNESRRAPGTLEHHRA